MIQYPEVLPIPLLANYQLQDVDPLQRTQMDSGRVRNRRRFRNVPTDAQVQHIFTQEQFEMFAGWWAHIIFDGALAYSARVRTATGMGDRQLQPKGMYQAALIGKQWRVSYSVQIMTRDLPSEQRTLELVYLGAGDLAGFTEDVAGVLSGYYTDSW